MAKTLGGQVNSGPLKKYIGFEKLADGNTPTRLIAYKLERSVAAVYNKASERKNRPEPN